MRIAIAQFNPTVGDYEANYNNIIAWVRRANGDDCDLIIFPEMSLCGYPVWDLANKKDFVAAGQRYLKRIAAETKRLSIALILGFIDESRRQSNKSFNAAAFISGGHIKALVHKRLLPTYDVFLEGIFFQPGHLSPVIPFKGKKIGLTICEDIWDEGYGTKPVRDLVRRGADWIINISASPYYREVLEKRMGVIRRHVLKHGIPLLYVNQVGGQDDLIFDGRSLLVSASGKKLLEMPSFEESLLVMEWDGKNNCRTLTPPVSFKKVHKASTFRFESEVYRALVLGVRDYCRKNGFAKALLGLSGGIDSALVACLAADALGPENVLGVTMPGNYSSEGSWKDAQELAKTLGIQFQVRPIRESYESHLKIYREQELSNRKGAYDAPIISLAMENLQARLRGLTLMYLSNDEGRILLTTGNKSELAVGYCTLYGDMAGGLAVIGDVYKTDVYALARYRNSISHVIPLATIEKPPSAELRPNQKDQDSLPPYEILDLILKLYIEENKGVDSIIRSLGREQIQPALIREIIRKVDHNEYKRRQTPPVLRVTRKAWFGRRMPITNRFKE